MRRRLAAFPAEALQHLGLLIAFILLISAREFAAAHPALTALLVFVFSFPYLLASVATRRAHFLYATMLLGAVSYFLTCYALGAPETVFPLLSLPLVAALWLVGQHLRKRLGAGLASFPRTVFRAMGITVAVFAAWAAVEAPGLLGGPGLGRFVAAAAYLGYAGLYLAHVLYGAPSPYVYLVSLFLTAGAALLGGALSSVSFCWLPILAAAAVMLGVGTESHRARTYGWSRHFYFSGVAALMLSLVFSALRWSFFLFDLALASLVLWQAYGRLARAVGDVRRATTVERALAKWLFLGSMALCLPLVPTLFLLPGDLNVAIAALLYGLLFGGIAWQRREGARGRNPYLLAVMLFAPAGLLGIGRALPGWGATAWSLAVPAVLLAALGLLSKWFREAADRPAQRALAEGAVFPVFFAWYVPLLAGEQGAALACALTGLAGSVVLAIGLADGLFLRAVGPAGAGALVAIALLLAGAGAGAWTACFLAAVVAGGLFVWADAAKRDATRVAANLAWLTLSVAAVAIAGGTGAGEALCSVTGVGFIAILIAGWRRKLGGRDLFDAFVGAVAALATAGAVVLGPLSGWGPASAGACLLTLAAACAVSWGLGLGLGHARAAAVLFALGMLLAIFGLAGGAEARLLAGAGVVAALFALAAAARDRFPDVSRSWAVVGHLAAIVLAVAALIQAWPLAETRLALAALPLVALYGLMPRLRGTAGFRVGAVCWVTFVALFALAALGNTPYCDQAPLLAVLALVWLALGYRAQHSRAKAWTVPFYLCAALLAAFCGAVSVFSPAVEGSWRVFLVNGIVFASLFLILRQDIFAYLLTLSLALMAYDWVKASTSRFTQDVLFYLVIGTVVLGVFFLLPYIKRLVDRLGTLPMISIFTRRGAALTSVPIMCGGVLVLSAYSVKITEHPKFCVSCHYMGEYYESWQHSSHRNVGCVQCHYEPGLGAEMKGKMAGMVQLFKYVAHAYGNKPHAQINNSSCMREGCHAGMDHSKQTLLFRGKIKFSHEKHLSDHPRGKELNCVSCHGQVVEGKHISVTETTCLTCHFYGRGTKPVAAGDCQTCHPVPDKPVRFAGQTFNHREFLKDKKDVRCVHCHSQVTQGDGLVSSTRCQSCHLHQAPMEVKDQAQFHLVHVSKGHFNCLQCHDEIRHGPDVKSHDLMASGNCSACHGDGRHSVQERIYAGAAVAGVKTEPDVMYKAGVACDGCHTDVQLVKVGEANYTSRVSGARQCASCHGDKDYGELLAEWQKDTKQRLTRLQPALADLEKACQAAAAAPKDKLERARQLLAAAQTRVACVVRDGSYGAHNNAYVSALLDSAEADLKAGRALLDGQAAPPQESGE